MHGANATSEMKLESGECLVIRAALPQDTSIVKAFLEGLSSEARWLRYHSPVPVVRWWMVEAVTAADHDQREALLAFLDGKLVGLAEWGREADSWNRAHVGIVVDDHVRRRGVAQALLRSLSGAARRHGIRDFVATVMSANAPALSLVRRIAPVHSSHFEDGAIEVVIPLRPRHSEAATA